MDEIAKLNVEYEGAIYRLTVFKSTVSIERQPDGPLCLLSKAKEPDAARLYNARTGAWNLDAALHLINRYPEYTPNPFSDFIDSLFDEE